MCRVVRHTMQALPFRSMLYSEIDGDKTEMRVTLALARMLRLVPLFLVLILFASTGFAQGTVIEPCTPTPSPDKVKPNLGSVSGNSPQIKLRASETLIDATIPDDEGVDKLLSPYTGKVHALDIVIGTLEGELDKSGVGANTMGNFVADGIRVEAGKKLGKAVALSFTNAGGLRKSTLMLGELKAVDIFELLPFENSLIQVDLTGAQILKLLERVTAAHDAQSGAIIQYHWLAENKSELIAAKLIDADGHEREIDPGATYKVVTIDYLLKVGSGNYAILQDGKNITPLNLTLRDAIMQYVKDETSAGRPVSARLDKRFVQVGPDPAKAEARPQ